MGGQQERFQGNVQVMNKIPNSCEDMVPLAIEHCSPTTQIIPENYATLLNIYWSLYSICSDQ